MQVLKEQTSDSTATIEIKLVKADYEPEVNKALRDYQRKASVPGFRPGKVPFGMVKKMYGHSILADQVNKIVSDSLNNYIQDNEIRILGYPMADAERTGTFDFDKDEEFNFYFNVALAPEINIDLSEFNLTYPKITADPDEVQKTIDKLLADYPRTTYPESVEQQDALELRVSELNDEGVEVQDGYQTIVKLNVSDITGEDSKNDLLNKVLGSEFVLNLNKAIGDNDKTKKLLKLNDEQTQLLNADYNVIIDEIMRKEPSEMNEDFFNTIFPEQDVATEEDFRQRIKSEIEKQFDQQADYLVYSMGLKKILEETPISFPREFMMNWIVENANGKLSAKEVDENYDEYEKSMRFQLVEEYLIGKYPELKVESQEVRRFVMSYFFGQMPQDMEIDEQMEKSLSSTVDSILKNNDEKQRIIHQLRERKMVALFKSKLTLTEQAMSPEEFKNFVSKNQPEQTEADENE
ncbi:MAG: trigger factor family protein [Bacteroidales bacterium]|nr:trigger factor family protein [Bacteroidales bacterium]